MTEAHEVAMAGPRLAVQVAELIRLAATQSQLDRREIADRMGVSESRLSQIIDGDGNFHTATLARYFAATGCALDVHLYRENGREVEIPTRGKRRSQGSGRYFLHNVHDGNSIQSVVAYSRRGVEGTVVDFPSQYESAAEAYAVIDSRTVFETAFAEAEYTYESR